MLPPGRTSTDAGVHRSTERSREFVGPQHRPTDNTDTEFDSWCPPLAEDRVATEEEECDEIGDYCEGGLERAGHVVVLIEKIGKPISTLEG